MKWYKKQLDAMKDTADKKKLDTTSGAKNKQLPKNKSLNPVKARNVNRPKTDLY